MNFQLINEKPIEKFITKRVTIINDSAKGFERDKIDQYLNMIAKEANSEIVSWSKKHEYQF